MADTRAFPVRINATLTIPLGKINTVAEVSSGTRIETTHQNFIVQESVEFVTVRMEDAYRRAILLSK